MSTPIEPFGHTPFAGETLPVAPPETTPDNPPWGVIGGVGLWLASVALMLICPLVFLIPYILRQRVDVQRLEEFTTSDPTAVFLQIVSIIPAHLLTLGVAWLIITRAGQRPFLRSLGWEWGWGRGRGFGLLISVALAVVLLIIGTLIVYMSGSPETPLDKMLKTSRAAAIATAFLATFTAPLVEEVVYRGALYSGLRKYLGSLWAGLFVIVLFALIHVPQYITSPGTIAVILLLSAALTFIRAYTGHLLPCVVIHTVFNGIQSVFIIVEPYFESLTPNPTPVPAPDPALILRLLGLF